MSHNNVKFCFGLTLTLIMLQTTAPALVIQDSQQTSTNGSYVAFLGCDGDMDTFSLTNNAVNQFWSMTLRTPTRINWIFVSTGTGTYTIDVSSAGNILSRCANISESSGQNTDKMERIITCRDLGYILGRVIISSSKERHLKIYEVDIIGTSQLNKNMILNFSDIMDTASRVLDNNLENYNSEERSNASWFVRLDAVYALKWILISIRGGQFEIHICVGNTATNLSTRCKAFELAGPIKRQQTAVECDKVMNGDTLVVKKIDAGSLRLFEVYLIICPENHFGPNCARCRQSCWSCDSITGECTQCNGPYYGEYCQYRCPANCLNLTCDQRTGSCNGCEEGFEGKSCEHEITTQDILTVCPPNHFGQNCEKCRQKCRSCDSITGECTQCQISFYGKNCLHRCPINCFDLICDRKTGECNGCLQGYKGRHCEQNIATSISTTTIGTTAYVIQEARQTSTNESYVASLGCDGDMDTFSLTNSGRNQSWSMTLKTKIRIIWLFISIGAGTYTIDVLQNGAAPTKCSTSSSFERIINAIITCPYLINRLDDEITISNAENNPLKIYEVQIMGGSTINQKMILNFSDIMDTQSNVLDNNLDTYYNSEERNNASWFLRLDAIYLMKWFLISIRGGTYELHITVWDTVMNLSTLCKSFSYPGLKHYQTSVECNSAIFGNTIVVKKMDEGSLRLFELLPIICPLNHFGPNCAKCREKCQVCDPINGKCSSCQNSYFGENCRNKCSRNCLDLICDQTIGTCNGCKHGFEGRHCEHQVVASIVSRSVETSIELFNSSFNISIRNKDVFGTIQDNNNKILLFCIAVILVILLAVTTYLFVLRMKKMFIKENLDDNDITIEFDRRISTHESDLEGIMGDGLDDLEEDMVTVEYNNLTSHRMSVNTFIDDLPSKKTNGALEAEFNDLPNGLLESYSNALKSFNKNKNRYKGIYPYDYNCVSLRTNDVKCDEYTNASYIHGLEKEQAYIAAQGPFNPKTLEDFWGIVWQSNSSRIVMLTNLCEGDKMQCLKYWPDTELIIGPFIITIKNEDVYEEYTLRYLVVQHKKEEKKVTQFHFTAWPENSVPRDVMPLICFRNLVRKEIASSDGPIVVHCSAGIGRTGTFIALDYLLEEGAAEQRIDVKGYVIALRHQRGKSIQTFEQYTFLHDALAEGLKAISPIFKGML